MSTRDDAELLETLVRRVLDLPQDEVDALIDDVRGRDIRSMNSDTIRFAMIDVLKALRDPEFHEQDYFQEWPVPGALR